MSIPATLIGQLLLVFAVVVLFPSQQRGRRHTIEIHNHTKSPIQRIYVSSTTEDGWGDDRMGNDTLSPDHYWPIEVPTGNYDFKIVGRRGLKPCMLMEETISSDTKLEVTENASQLTCRIGNDIH
jgi:hypothetical protein